MKKPPVPLTRYYMSGLRLPFTHPSWMYDNDFYCTPCGVYVSLDGTKTYPERLTTSQQFAVSKLRETRDYYAKAEEKSKTTPSDRAGFGNKALDSKS